MSIKQQSSNLYQGNIKQKIVEITILINSRKFNQHFNSEYNNQTDDQ